MNLGIVESHLLAALKRALPGDVVLASGPAVAGPATSLRAEVFVHAARFEDFGGVTAEGVHAARRHVQARAGVRGVAEERPARIVVDVTCVCASLRQVEQLSALAAAPALLALETMPDPLLAALPDASVSLQFADFAAVVHACETTRWVNEKIASHQARLTFHVDGFLHVRITQRGGLAPKQIELPRPVRPAPRAPGRPVATRRRRGKVR